jgi:hypothetical protein
MHLSYQRKSIIVDGCVRSFLRAIMTSTYGSNYIVCFKCFIIVGVCYNNYEGFQTKVYKISSCYSARKTIKEKLVHCENSVSLISLRSRYVLY